MFIDLYSIPVFAEPLQTHNQVQEDFTNIIQDDSNFNKYPSWYCNVDTTFGLPDSNKLPFHNFIKGAVAGLNTYLKKLGVDCSVSYGVECWLNRYSKNQHQELHNHAGESVISCAYMLKLPPNSGRFVNILLLQDALGIVKDSCLVQDIDMVVSQLSQSRVVGIFMDSSSELEHDRVYSNAFVLSWQDGEDEDIYFCHDILFLESSSLDCLTKPGNSPSSTSIHSYLEEFCPGATTTCKALPTMEAKQCSLQAIENTENYWNELEMEEENMGSPGPALRWITSFLWATTTMASMLV